MAIIEGWLPPSRENWEFYCTIWQLFPLVTVLQWMTDYYPQGKTSNDSRFNIPGKWGWMLMEIPGFITVLYIMNTLPQELGIKELPWGNWTMAGCFTIHYIYRAVIAPLFLNPSMSPIHPFVAAMATAFQVSNGISLGGWLGGHGPTTAHDWAGRLLFINIGLIIWGWGLLANIYHDDDLREIRRAAARRQEREAKDKGAAGPQSVDKIYMLPKNGLFRWALHAHYLCEWIEWAGFWMVGGWGCVPARTFLVNEIMTMTPRALLGKRWYEEKFGKDKVADRWAVIPGLL